MQTVTEIGMNHSGMLVAEDGGQKMLENIELTRPNDGDERALAKIRLEYAKESDPVGTLPEPQQSGFTAAHLDQP